MSIGSLATEPAHGYLSESSKRRFTLVAGILGAVFFLAQFLLPMLVMFLVMMPMMFDSVASIPDLDQAGLWRDELWFIERTPKVNWREPENSTSLSALRHVSLKDLESAGPAIPLDASKAGSSAALLPVADRLWVIEADRVSYYQNGVLTRLAGAGRAARSSRPFAYQGRPAVISLGSHPSLATLQEEGARAVWTPKDLPWLCLPRAARSEPCRRWNRRAACTSSPSCARTTPTAARSATGSQTKRRGFRWSRIPAPVPPGQRSRRSLSPPWCSRNERRAARRSRSSR